MAVGNTTLAVSWDDARRSCTITATATGAPNMRVEAGYSRNNYTIGSKLAVGTSCALTVSDLNHGTGQLLYIHAIPENADGTQYAAQEIFRTIPIPNPILGVLRPSCEEQAAGAKQLYIVDIVEHKTNNTCTPRWQNGDRIVKKNPC